MTFDHLVIGNEATSMPLAPQDKFEWWYRYYFATERGRLGYKQYRRDSNKLICRQASPNQAFDDATFDRSAAAFDIRIMSRS